ncbi:kappaPI-actitoxin-Avd3d [Orussus abietinus]|uniref:kappaPI-actitoxin-Avd3d n=1 Tax=Orussus abietinus TaxID=222816 RepID=UPI000625AC81|nr:kappaPI-actitoxin-Avd3d [Orussus abietinus]
MIANFVLPLVLLACLCAAAPSKTAPTVCELPMVKGNCRALMPRYRYDSRAKDCLPFNYGGCGGNRNNFLSREQCMETCKGV